LQPFRPLAAGADLATAQKIAFRDDADELASVVHDGKAADMGPQHDPGRFLDRGVRRDGDHVFRHDLVRAHD